MVNQVSNDCDYNEFDQNELQKYQGLLKKSYDFHKNL